MRVITVITAGNDYTPSLHTHLIVPNDLP